MPSTPAVPGGAGSVQRGGRMRQTSRGSHRTAGVARGGRTRGSQTHRVQRQGTPPRTTGTLRDTGVQPGCPRGRRSYRTRACAYTHAVRRRRPLPRARTTTRRSRLVLPCRTTRCTVPRSGTPPRCALVLGAVAPHSCTARQYRTSHSTRVGCEPTSVPDFA
eukprot:2466901-Rhodomonas_salina.1